MVNTVISLMHVQMSNAVSQYLDTFTRCVLQHLTCTHFCYKQPAWVPVEIGPHISGEACTHIIVGRPSPMTGASWCPERATNTVFSATPTEYRTQRGLHKALLERGGNRLPSWKHIRPSPSGSQYVFAFYIHREIHPRLRVRPHPSILHWFKPWFLIALLRNVVGCPYEWMQSPRIRRANSTKPFNIRDLSILVPMEVLEQIPCGYQGITVLMKGLNKSKICWTIIIFRRNT